LVFAAPKLQHNFLREMVPMVLSDE